MAACGAVLALRAKLLRDPRIRMPLPLLGPHTPENDALTLYMLEKSYYTLFPRLNALAFGVMAALIYSNTQMMDLFNRCYHPLSLILYHDTILILRHDTLLILHHDTILSLIIYHE